MSDEQIHMKLTVHARGLMATQLLEAAEHLGYGPEVIRSQSDGFKVPVEVHKYLFPSEYQDEVDEPTDFDPATSTPEEDFAPEPGDDNPDNLTEDELDKLTKPDGE